ncbi:MAG: hypothetical protein GEU82_17630 [Luteitalea sp.]|nr:hypothetical protein [Luteitalea sp.]
MRLRGQHGYAMVVLLIGMAILAILMTAAMPVWRQASQREKEAELIFRGEQYVRAIKLFSQRAGPGVLPPSVDVLVKQKFLRQRYKDPVTGLDFDLLGATQAQGGAPPAGRGAAQTPPAGRGPTPASRGGRGSAEPSPSGAGTIIQGRGGAGAGGINPGAGGIIGVASKSKDTSIRLYNGRSRYNEWQFVYVQQVQQPGAVTPGPGGQPQRGRGPQPPGPQRGGPPTGRPGLPGPGGRSGMPPAPTPPGPRQPLQP